MRHSTMTNILSSGAEAERSFLHLQGARGIRVVTLDNPPLNVVGDTELAMLDAALAATEVDFDARVLIVTGAGERAFSAGSNIKEFPAYLARDTFISDKLARENRVYSRIADLPLPTIAAIEGAAFGGGLELAVCCDLIVASSSARFGLPEVKIGGFPGSGGIVRVPRRIGYSRAARMMFFGNTIDAQTALDWGLIDEICAPGEALATASALAARLDRGPAVALRACKIALVAARRTHEPEALAMSLKASAMIAESDDFRACVDAFVAKRPSPLARTQTDKDKDHGTSP